MNENRIPEMLTVKDIAKKFGLSEAFVKAKAMNGEISAVMAGRKILIDVEKFSEYLNTNASTTVEASPKSKAKPKE